MRFAGCIWKWKESSNSPDGGRTTVPKHGAGPAPDLRVVRVPHLAVLNVEPFFLARVFGADGCAVRSAKEDVYGVRNAQARAQGSFSSLS